MSRPQTQFDVIVVGAGVEGSATAYQLISNGAKRVLLLEQFSAINSRGSSHGSSRIIRRAHIQPHYNAMMHEAYEMWEDIGKKYGTQLLIRTGMLSFGPDGNKELEQKKDNLTKQGRSNIVFSADEANRRYPYQLKLPPHYKCIFDEDGGILLATKCVAALQKLFVDSGGVLKDFHKVTKIIPGDMVTVTTSCGNFMARRVIITAGPWTPKIMKQLGVDLPVVITRAEIPYWRVEHPEHFSVGSWPVFKEVTTLDDKNIQQFFNGIPVLEYPGLLKVAQHSGPIIDPDDRDGVSFPHSIKSVSNFIRRCLKGVSTTPSICEPCLYTESPDEEPIIDRHPHHPNIIYATGFSGHGFQKGPVIGKLLMEMALDRSPSYDCSPFRLERFNKLKSNL